MTARFVVLAALACAVASGCDTRVELERDRGHAVVVVPPPTDRPLDRAPTDPALTGDRRYPGLEIILTWDAPASAARAGRGVNDHFDLVGTDLDLHLVRPGTVYGPDRDKDGLADGWFDPEHDVYFLQQQPSWGEPGPSDDPVFIYDVMNASAPERIQLAGPEAGLCYKVGVHGWEDSGLGASAAAVEIFIAGELVFASPEVRVAKDDLWAVAKICWADDKDDVSVVDCDGRACAPLVMSQYPRPNIDQ